MTEFDVNNFDSIRIGLASAEQIRSWSHGEVKKPETINYRTLKPERDGLFCERIFGPTKDWECACGKYKRIRFKGVVCERCGVEVTRAKVRRERMGHIELATPVSHIWYFKGSPSRLGYLLDIPPKELEKVLYYASSIITSVDEDLREQDAAELKDEVAADLEELDAEMNRLIEATRRLSTDYAGEDADTIDEDDKMDPDEVEDEIEDIKDEYAERKELRVDAYDTFMKIEPKMLISDEALYREMRLNYSEYFTGGMGAAAVRDLLDAIDLQATSDELRDTIHNGRGQKRAKAIKRLKVVDAFLHGRNQPRDMILDVLPVIPPDLRPMVQLDGGRFATSDLNDLYRRVINRNNRLKRLLSLGAPEIIVNNEKRMLQEAVDALFDNGRRGRPVTGPGNRPLKSLADMLKGKQGRFRQNLLGKRVDYSGRSVIVVGPSLKLHQCGVPKIMALELFKPFVMKRLVELDYAANIKAAKRAVDRGSAVVWDVLEEVIKDHPVLLNRAPTLHRLGIQAFEPVLVEGKALKLHPLVCAPFNADFDGDQMAIHVPLSSEAQAEARVLMLSSNNIKSPAHGRPLTVPSQDMVLGIFYLTSVRDGFPGEGDTFASFKDARLAYDARSGVDLQSRIFVRLEKDTTVEVEKGKFEEHKAGSRLETSIGRITFNNLLPDDYPYINHVMDKSEIARLVEDCCNRYRLADVPPILDGLKAAGFHYATRAGLTVSIFDATIPPEKPQLLEKADQEVAAVDEDYEMGLMSYGERHRQVVDIWTRTTDEVGDAMVNNFEKFNPIYMMATSGARGNLKQIRQLAGMRGLIADPKGEIIDRPIKGNFREGMSVMEYFLSTHGTRKGLSDTALRTADSGYLTRRLVDVAQDVIVREHDCGTDDGIEYSIFDDKGDVDHNLVGRAVLHDVTDPSTGEVLLAAGEYITGDDVLADWQRRGIESVEVRTVMTCRSHRGVCQKCYGWDLATGLPINIGSAVGIIAAQSIGEPGTQLTMRTFHSGGVAGDDITQGLPRVTELFEARKPKGQAILAEISGNLQITNDKLTKTLAVSNDKGEVREYTASARAQLMPGVADGVQVTIGQQLTKGSINPHDLLRLTDAHTTLRYIVQQVQGVYQSQGVDINDKHIEVIVRQMLRKVSVLEPGSSEYLPGRQVDRIEFEDEARRIGIEGGEVPTAQPLLLGITKASLATDSFLSAASFQETTKVLTDAAIEGKVDHLQGLKENVLIGKPIPAGTGMPQYRNVELTYKGEKVTRDAVPTSEKLPEWAPSELREAENLLPQPKDWTLNGEDYMGVDSYGNYLGAANPNNTHGLPPEVAKLYLFDDLGVSQRWANKFSEAGIEMVGDLVGKTESDLLHIEGIGAKAIEELRAGLEERDLLYILEQNDEPKEPDVNQLLEMVFSPDDDNLYLGGDVPSSYSADPDAGLADVQTPSLPRSADDEASLDELLNTLGSIGLDSSDE